MEFDRVLDVGALLKKKSFFLLGPRATGKSFLIRQQLGDRAVVIDLLRSDLFLRLAANPSLLESLIDGGRARPSDPVVIDEVQKLLEDTLVGFLLPAWVKSKKRKAISTAKFYFFDTGVTHALAGTQTLDRNSDIYGRSFEHWLAMELRAYLDYRRHHEALSYWRSVGGQEVDFVIGDHTAVEVKASRRIGVSDLRGLEALAEEKIVRHLFLVSEDPVETKRGAIRCLPWQRFLDELWGGEIL